MLALQQLQEYSPCQLRCGVRVSGMVGLATKYIDPGDDVIVGDES